MEPKVTGISFEKTERFILDMYDYSEKISALFNNIEDVVNATNDSYVSDEAQMFRDKFLEFKDNFKIVNDNILSYADDLNRARHNYENRRDDMVVTLNTFAREKSDEIL